ncbi:GtrA family protein [Tessaracoccus antarcticus]|uniref:GtrA family protein n=1 Tax=Tessaracoccus antarcticus TaxID=2479848 RepID=A0A3M0G481_9ACTN|nr:GtrA family protein [Tessaracoccus antarcticus]RMB59800.1 GtrA family protein [Tessaracoccus antarcticus]
MNWLNTQYARYRNSIGQLFRFGVVGGLGVLVNTIALITATKLFPLVWPGAGIPEGEGVWWPIAGTAFNVRWYHVMASVAFMVANVFNFQLNRWWTFKSNRASGWFREYWPFLTVGLAALAIGQLVFTALMNQGSPVALPTDILDGSSGFRSRIYWANLIMIVCTIPISFLLNKFWTFRAVREVRESEELDHPEDIVVVDEAEA